MALLDYYFNPNTFRGIGGGLLDNLPEWLMQPGQGQFPPMALQGAQGGEEISSAGMQPQAPMSTQPQPQMPMGGGGAGEGGGLLSGLQGWLGNNSNMLIALGAGLAGGNGWSQGISQGLQGALKGRQLDQSQQSKTFLERALMQRGLDPQMARAVSSNPQLANAVLPNLFGAKSTDDIREYEYAKSQGFAGNLADWMARKRAGAGEYGLQPIWGRDKDGNPVMLQAGKTGEAIQTKLPEGVSLSGKEPLKIDAGTHFVLMDPLTRNTIGIIPKNIAEKKVEEARGEARGKAEVSLPDVLNKSEQALKVIDQIEKHPGLSRGTGMTYWMSAIPGTEAHNFKAAVEQLEGKAFLEAFESLKGGGQITEIEGQKATQAIARLKTSQTEAAFREALKDLRDVIQTAMARARLKAGQSQQPGAQSRQPAAGNNIDDLVRKYAN